MICVNWQNFNGIRIRVVICIVIACKFYNLGTKVPEHILLRILEEKGE